MKILNIIINQEVKNYLRMMGSKTITVYTRLMTSCWSPRLDTFVKLKEPAVPENFNKYEVDGINIYIYKEAVLVESAVQIELARYASDLPDKDFEVFGLER